MRIAGLQKMTLLDYPGRVACTVFLPGCNFRCPFCHNSGLFAGETTDGMSAEELLRFLDHRRGLLDGVCISGGEPTLSPGLPELLGQIKAMGFAVKLDTNGSRTQVLKDLLNRGLVDYVAMDVKSDPAGYAAAVGLETAPLEAVEESLKLLMTAHIGYELRTTVVQELHDEAAITRMGQWLMGLSGGQKILKLFLQPFVNRCSVPNQNLHAPESTQLARFVEVLRAFVQEVSIRG